jgi:hypothetical protein
MKGETSDAGCAGLVAFLNNRALRVNAKTHELFKQKQLLINKVQ